MYYCRNNLLPSDLHFILCLLFGTQLACYSVAIVRDLCSALKFTILLPKIRLRLGLALFATPVPIITD